MSEQIATELPGHFLTIAIRLKVARFNASHDKKMLEAISSVLQCQPITMHGC